MYDNDMIQVSYNSEDIAIQLNLTHLTVTNWIRYAIKKFPEMKDSFREIIRMKRKVYIIDQAGYSYICNRYRGMKPASSEYEFKNCIMPFLTEMGYDVVYQKTILTYRVDFYVVQLNMVIEYDEDYHKRKTVSQYDTKREYDIKTSTGCEFVRIHARYDTIRALGYIANQIYKRKLEITNTLL